MSILLSVNPPYAGWLVDGIKEIEWRKGALPTGRAYVYETKKCGGSGMVIGEVRFLGYTKLPTNLVPADYIQRGRVDKEFLQMYAGSKPVFANFTCTNLRYKEPRPLSDYSHFCDGLCLDSSKGYGCEKVFQYSNMRYCDHLKRISRPPQSWMYVEEV